MSRTFNEKEYLFEQIGIMTTDIDTQKNEFGPYFILYAQMNSKWIITQM